MALTFEELESVTNDYFMADDKKAVDIYFNTSFLLTVALRSIFHQKLHRILNKLGLPFLHRFFYIAPQFRSFSTRTLGKCLFRVRTGSIIQLGERLVVKPTLN